MNKTLFVDICKQWADMKRLSVKYSTFVKYEGIIDRYIIIYFKNITIAEINNELMIKYFDDLFHQHRYSNSTITSIRFILKSVCHFIHLKYGIDTCNMDLIKLSKKHTSITILSKQQKTSLSNHCFIHYDSISLAVLIALYGGLRIGEICALQWADVRFDEECLMVSKSVQRIKAKNHTETRTSLLVSEPKTETSNRIVPLPLFVIEYIKEYQSNYSIEEAYYILTNSTKIPDPRTVQYQFTKLCSIYDFKMNFHALRHCYATSCVTQEIDIKSLSEILGHSSVTTTLNLYVHSSLEQKKLQISKLSRT